MLSIEKCSQLSAHQLVVVRQLVDVCNEYDQCEAKFYWNVIQERVNDDFADIIFKVEGHIIGYLAIYHFSDDEAEISAVVHPDFRTQGVFHRLWEEAQYEIKRMEVSAVKFITHTLASASKDCLKAIGAKYLYREIRFETSEPLKLGAKRKIRLEIANSKNIPLIADIDQQTTGILKSLTLERLEQVINEPNRRIYLAYSEDVLIGKMHFLFLEDTAYLHDFMILPEYQKKGYGSFFFKTVINQILEEGKVTQVELDTQDNELAHFYRACKMTETGSFEYWGYSLNFHQETVRVLH
ncbi:MAG: GNAT family N-acetyltransferase [Gammaproteobacteria bacterium]|nr:GNAT family N-acetyltransferase [Gammaproteobacteria bacterium]